ncbi:MAG TPA: hypothetical protein VHD76_23545 [Bryobacteraceae bacterium]|jgi:hypothetical protein|nr:hypothetical protein [Bryobacteraceae bacterium]
MANQPDQTPIVAVIEGRVRERGKEKFVLDISDGVAVELPAAYVSSVEEIVDKPSQRNFVRVQVKESKNGDDVILRVNPRMLSIVDQSRGLPLPFMTRAGMAFGAEGVLPAGPESALIGGRGAGGDSLIFPLGSWGGGGTTCMEFTCTESTSSGWGVSCDKSAGDIGVDDPGDGPIQGPF